MTIQVLGTLVTAGVADLPTENDRQKWYTLLPHGQESAVMASGHKFTVPGPGLVKLPAEPAAAHVNEEHDRKRPVGRFSAFKETAGALFGRVDYANTTAGSDALVLASEGLRKGISVELEGAVIRAGKLLSATLSGAGLVVAPSFAGAVLASAADIGEVTAEVQSVIDSLKPAEGGDTPPAAPDLQELAAALSAALDKLNSGTTPPEEKETPDVTVTAAQRAAQLGAGNATTTPTPDPLMVLAAAQAQLTDPSQGTTVHAAALDTVTQADVYDKVTPPEYAGELWKGRRYNPRYLELFTPATLTKMKVTGWRWVEGKTPQVALWSPPFTNAPDGRQATNTMNDIPTNEVQAEDASWTGIRIAGGHRFDRIHTDFPDAEWWASYNLESTDDFARKLDAELIKHLTLAKNLTTLEVSTSATDEERILEALGMVSDFADSDYVMIGWDVFKRMALAKKFDQSVAASSPSDQTVSLEGGSFSTTYLGKKVKASGRSDTAAYGRVLAGCKAANELRTLPGGPIRVNAEEIQKGAIQHGVFGYALMRDIDKRGVVEVKATQAPAL